MYQDYKQVPSESITIEPWVTGLLFGVFLLAGIGALIYKLLQETVTFSYSGEWALSVNLIKCFLISTFEANEKTNKAKTETAAPGESQGFAEYQKRLERVSFFFKLHCFPSSYWMIEWVIHKSTKKK